MSTIIMLTFMFAILWQASANSFTVLSSSINPNYAKSTTSEYRFVFRTPTPINQLFDLHIKFPFTEYPGFLLHTSNCSIVINGNDVAGEVCTYNPTLGHVIFSNLPSNPIVNYTVVFWASTANYATTSNLIFYYRVPTTDTQTSILANTVQVSTITSQMQCSWTSSTQIVGANSNFNVTFSAPVEIESSTVVQISIDPWSTYKQSNFISTSTADICGSSCTLTVPSNNANLSELIKYSNFFPTTHPPNTNSTLLLNSARNPASTKPISYTITLFIRNTQNSLKAYSSCTQTFSVNTPNTFSNIIFTNTNKAIGASNTITLGIAPKNPLSSLTFIRIDPRILPLSFSYNSIFPFGSTPTVRTSANGTVEISNLLTSGLTSAPTFMSINNLILSNPPYSTKKVTITFTTLDNVTGALYPIDTANVQIWSEPSTIDSAGLQIADGGINVYTSYTIWFKTKNGLVSGSFIIFTFPNQISLDSATCSLNNYPTSTCSINTDTTLTINIPTTIPGQSNLTITVNNVRNPPTTTKTNTIQIRTYYEDSQSLVDQLLTGQLLRVQAGSVIVGNVVLSAASLKVGDVTTYTMTVTVTNALPKASIMKIQIPSQSYPVNNIKLVNFTISGTLMSQCTMTSIATPQDPMYYQLNTNCFAINTPAFSDITIVLDDIINPSSTQPPQSWSVQTLYNGLQMEYNGRQIYIQMVQPSDFLSSDMTPTSVIVNEINSFTFDLGFRYSHFSGDKIIVVLPSGMIALPNSTCTTTTPNVALSCIKNDGQNMIFATIQLLNGQQSFSYISFTISNVRSNWFVSTQTIVVQTTNNQSTGTYYVEQSSQTIAFTAATLTTSAVSDDRIMLLGESQIQLTIGSPFIVDRAPNQSLVSITVQTPSHLTPLSNSCEVSYPDAVCSLTSTRIFTITNVKSFSTPITMTFAADTDHFTLYTSNFTIKLVYDETINIASSSSLRIQVYCANPCKSCQGSPTNCLSCLPSPYAPLNNTLHVVNNTCLKDCPPTFYETNDNSSPDNDLICLQCDQNACLNCRGTATNCTSCATQTYLLTNQCRQQCPDTYYQDDETNTCQLCKFPCKHCESQEQCQNCQPNYFLDVDMKCVLTCSLPNYIGLDGECQKCINNCATCSLTLTNCTSCVSGYLFHETDNTCRQTCPSRFYNKQNIACEACEDPCETCTSLSTCVSCVDTYYLHNGNSCTQDCPPGYIPIVDVCEPCDEQCETCTNLTSFCTTCQASLLFYENKCLQQCPPLTYPYNKTCTTCIQPCVTCADSPQLCESCIQGKFLLGNSCVNQCPLNQYFVSGAQCLSCSDNCLFCQSVALCTMCQQGYYLLNGACVSKCPESSPIVVDQECSTCAPQCASCQGKVDNCTACTIYYFKYEYTCVEECPLAFYSNVATYQCQDGLTSRITFFPILIIAFIVTVVIIISKCSTSSTSLATSLTCLFSPLELAIWIYILALMGREIKEPGVNYVLPRALLIIAIVFFFIISIIFHIFNKKRVESDQYAVQWCTNNVNYNTLKAVQYLSIPFGLKFFRIIYCRLFNAMPLSLAVKNPSNIFTLATVFSLLFMIGCQIMGVVACWSLIYNKSLKDQIFYSCLEGLIITLLSALVTLIDIYKPDSFFDESQFSKMKKYIQKIKDSSFNKLEEGFDISQDEGSISAEKYVGLSGNKLMYTKNEKDNKDLYFEGDEEKSQENQQPSEGVVTQAFETGDKAKQLQTTQKKKKINIFDPIMEEDEEYLEEQKFDIEQAYTQVKIQKINKKVKTLESDQEKQPTDQVQRKIQMGLDEPFDDKISMIGDRAIKQRWNDFMTKRKELIGKIAKNNTIKKQKIASHLEISSQFKQINSSQLKQVEFKTPYADDKMDQKGEDIMEELRTGSKRRRRKKRNSEKNKQLQEVYLQRLSDRKSKVNRQLFSEDKSNKYDF